MSTVTAMDSTAVIQRLTRRVIVTSFIRLTPRWGITAGSRPRWRRMGRRDELPRSEGPLGRPQLAGQSLPTSLRSTAADAAEKNSSLMITGNCSRSSAPDYQ
jgi:hypothetical protein